MLSENKQQQKQRQKQIPCGNDKPRLKKSVRRQNPALGRVVPTLLL
jgi:hypothetical protein